MMAAGRKPNECRRPGPRGSRVPSDRQVSKGELPTGSEPSVRPLGKNTHCVTPTPLERHPLRREIHRLREGWRPYADERCAKCGRVRIANGVGIRTRGGVAHYHGVMRCGTAWECPYCHAVLQMARAAEVRTVVEHHKRKYGRKGLSLVTLTVRHAMGEDLARLRSGVANAWRAVIRGAPYKRWQLRLGIRGFTKRLEVTHGPNGWHPHIHVIMYSLEAPTEEFVEWLRDRWATIVERQLGADNVPSEHRGVDVRPCRNADYLNKLGLELTAPNTKRSKGENRSPLDILAGFLDTERPRDYSLYCYYAVSMKGARMLTWSRGLKVAAGVTERSDAEIIEGDDAPEELVCIIRGEAWDQVRDMKGVRLAMLVEAEVRGREGVRQLLRALLVDWPPGADPLEGDGDTEWFDEYLHGWPFGRPDGGGDHGGDVLHLRHLSV